MPKAPPRFLDEIKGIDVAKLKDMRDVLPNTPVTPGQMIRAFRKNFGFTISEVHELTLIGETNISAIENDKKEIGVDRAMRFAAVFGIHPAHILFPSGFNLSDTPELEKIARQAQTLRQRKTSLG